MRDRWTERKIVRFRSYRFWFRGIRGDGWHNTICLTHLWSEWLLATGSHFKHLLACLHLVSVPALSCAALTSDKPTVSQHLANIMTELLSQPKLDQTFLARFQAARLDFCGLDSFSGVWRPWPRSDHPGLIRSAWAETTLSLRSLSSLALFQQRVLS